MKYDDVADVTTTYFGHKSIKIIDTFRPEQAFPINSNCHTWGQFVGGGMLDILLDTGASKSYMSKAFYMRHPHLHKYLKFNSAPPKRQLEDNTDNANPLPIASQPVNDNPIPVRHFEPNPLLEVPQQDKEPQEVTSQHPVHSAGNPNVIQDPFDT